MRFFVTNKAFRKAVLEAANDPARDPAFLLLRYAHNPKLLKRAAAAFYGWDTTNAIDKRNVSELDVFLRPYSRVIRAFAEGLQEERSGL